ncbi:MAG: hypothetical protein SGI77_23045 [Pirellulaceae bacterium]|nr:hypothetical protein [Pirellulaceae bacterium]
MQTISLISRAELFEALWQKPMTQLSEQWGISRKEIVQLCEQYSIPRPPNGYWAQLNWGTAPERPTLPTLDIADLIELDAFRKQFEKPTSIVQSPAAAGKEAHIQSKDCGKVQISVPDQLTNPHRFVKRLKSTNPSTAKELSNSGSSSNSNERVVQSWVSVSKPQFQRALRIADTLLKHWETRGFEVSVNGCLKSSDEDDEIAFSITETYKRVEKPKKDHYWREWDHVPTGVLTVEVHCEHFDLLRRRWSDGKVQKLETLIGSFLDAIPKYLAEIKQSRLDKECEQRQKKKADDRRLLQKQEVENENARRAELMKFVEEWETAQRIRRYLAAVDERLTEADASPSDPAALDRWLGWARWYADNLCPLTKSREHPIQPLGPTNAAIAELDLTSVARKALDGTGIESTDHLYAQSKEYLSTLYPYRPGVLLSELDRVLEGLGYNMDEKKWTYRWNR